MARRADKTHLTFDQCAAAYIEAKRHEWKNQKHAQQWTNTVMQHASPVFGKHLVQTITRDDVLKCLEPIWLTSNETASRLRGRIESILDWAKAKDLRHGDNPAAWRGGLQNLLSAPSKTQKIVNHPSLPYTELPAFMRRLQTTNGESASALIFLILTATRTSEVLNASWAEINDGVWAIPAGRMKAGREHRVPLSPAALELLDWRPKTGPFVFTNALLGDRPMSNMSMAMLLRRADMGHVTVHGFRSTFRNWAAECTSYPREVCEHALAHQLPDKVEAAYLRSDLLARRRALMGDWGVFCQSGAALPFSTEPSDTPAEAGKTSANSELTSSAAAA